MSLIARCPCRQCRHHGKTWVQIAAEDDERTLAARRKMKERALAAENQLRGAVAENEKLRLQVAALENDGMELAAKLGEAEEQIARLTATGGQ